MPKVTYVLGAGASANVLPVSNGINRDLEGLKEKVDKRLWALARKRYPGMPYPQQYMIPPKGNYGIPLFEAIDYLAEIAKSHPSLDTYARKLSLREGPEDDTESLRFRAAISCYFLLLHSLNGLDQRYDHFLASLLLRGRERGGRHSLRM